MSLLDVLIFHETQRDNALLREANWIASARKLERPAGVFASGEAGAPGRTVQAFRHYSAARAARDEAAMHDRLAASVRSVVRGGR